ncbi:MAG: hypothetical protein QXX87_04810 [Candidatus Jordarchaeales archaeon]
MSEDLVRLHGFITRVFKNLMNKIDAIAGKETVRTVFRLVGESVGERAEARMREKYGVKNWSLEKFVELLAKDVVAPVIGEKFVSFESSDGKARIIFTACPFEMLNFDITSKFYCTYTHGLIEAAARKALGDVKVYTESLRSDKNDKCTFVIVKQGE